MKLSVGQVVTGRFEVERVLGSGGTALVYLVRERATGTPYALKVLTVTSQTIRERMLREGEVQQKLVHLNVVQVKEVLDLAGAPGLLMEYIDGPSLESALGRYGLTLHDAETLFLGILSGVRAAHQMGLVHRDLKPANVLLARTPEGFVPKVTDFGLAKLLLNDPTVAHTRSGIAMGTPSYMAPEQIRDARSVDQRADLWSLGCLLYELCTRRRAFPGDEALAIYNAVVDGEFVPPRKLIPDIPKTIEQAIHGCLSIELPDRIPTCDALQEVLQGVRDWPILEDTVTESVDLDATPLMAAPAVAAARRAPEPRPPRPEERSDGPRLADQETLRPGGNAYPSMSVAKRGPNGATPVAPPDRSALPPRRRPPPPGAAAAMGLAHTDIEPTEIEMETVIVPRGAVDGTLAPTDSLVSRASPAVLPQAERTGLFLGGGLVAGLVGLLGVLVLGLGVFALVWVLVPGERVAPPSLPAPEPIAVPTPAPPPPTPAPPAPVRPVPVTHAPSPPNPTATPTPAPVVPAPTAPVSPTPAPVRPAPRPPTPTASADPVWVTVESVPPGMTIQLAGNRVGPSPMRAELKPGKVPVAVIGSDGTYDDAVVDVVAGGANTWCYLEASRTLKSGPCP
ncbi:MAG: serine/threonine protein kinase [Alphaproteobacteria bacterium]|nr:serine/threonine protein kinase [Alphaproteobacteria bacterium]